MSTHLTRLGKSLTDAVTGYNQFVGSLDAGDASARRLARWSLRRTAQPDPRGDRSASTNEHPWPRPGPSNQVWENLTYWETPDRDTGSTGNGRLPLDE